jgi:hypothetical protein
MFFFLAVLLKADFRADTARKAGGVARILRLTLAV